MNPFRSKKHFMGKQDFIFHNKGDFIVKTKKIIIILKNCWPGIENSWDGNLDVTAAGFHRTIAPTRKIADIVSSSAKR